MVEEESGRVRRNFQAAIKALAKGAATYALIDFALSRGPLANSLQRHGLSATQVTFLLNSVLSGSAGLRVIFGKEFEDDVHAYPDWLHTAFGNFTGYTAYDTAVLLLSTRGQKLTGEMMVHHVMAIVGTLASMTARQATLLPAATLTVEWSLLSVWWLQRVRTLRPGDAFAFRRALVIRTLSTLLFRSFILPYATVRTIRTLGRPRTQADLKEGVDIGATWRRAWKRYRLACYPWLAWGAIANVCLFSSLNLSWTAQMVKGTIKELQKPLPVAGRSVAASAAAAAGV